MSFEVLYGLQLNAKRVQMLPSVAVSEAISVALDAPSFAFFDAMASSVEEARFLMDKFRAMLRERATMSRR